MAELDPGTYLVSNAGNTPRAFTVTVPAGWHTEEGFISKGDGIGRSPGAVRELTVELDRQPRVRRCVCLRPEGDNLASLVETGTADEIARVIEVQGGHETIGPAATTLGGYPAQRLEFAFPADYDLAACDDDFLRPWPEPGPNFEGGLAAYVGQRAIDAPLSAGRARLLARLLRPWRRA